MLRCVSLSFNAAKNQKRDLLRHEPNIFNGLLGLQKMWYKTQVVEKGDNDVYLQNLKNKYIACSLLHHCNQS